MSKLKTLVLDSSYMARSIITPERAFVIKYKGNADVIADHNETFGLVKTDIIINKPSIIRVYKYINHGHNVPLNRRNIFRRDEWKCVYCGNGNKSELTLDHVMPQSKGGRDTWTNLVTACKKCNGEKRDLTLEEFDRGYPNPYRPHYLMLMRKVKEIPEEWKPYLFL